VLVLLAAVLPVDLSDALVYGNLQKLSVDHELIFTDNSFDGVHVAVEHRSSIHEVIYVSIVLRFQCVDYGGGSKIQLVELAGVHQVKHISQYILGLITQFA